MWWRLLIALVPALLVFSDFLTLEKPKPPPEPKVIEKPPVIDIASLSAAAYAEYLEERRTAARQFITREEVDRLIAKIDAELTAIRQKGQALKDWRYKVLFGEEELQYRMASTRDLFSRYEKADKMSKLRYMTSSNDLYSYHGAKYYVSHSPPEATFTPRYFRVNDIVDEAERVPPALPLYHIRNVFNEAKQVTKALQFYDTPEATERLTFLKTLYADAWQYDGPRSWRRAFDLSRYLRSEPHWAKYHFNNVGCKPPPSLYAYDKLVRSDWNGCITTPLYCSLKGRWFDPGDRRIPHRDCSERDAWQQSHVPPVDPSPVREQITRWAAEQLRQMRQRR